MLSKKTLSALILCALALSSGARSQPAAMHQESPQPQHQGDVQQPKSAQEPVKYQLLLASSLLLVMFGRRGAVRAQPWSNS